MSVVQWFKVNKVLIAIISLVGSIAGVAFSTVDLNDALKAKRKAGKS